MDYFSPIPEGQAIILSRGVYRQSAVFSRAGKVYAKYGAGFVRLMQGGASSHPNIRWVDIDTGEIKTIERHGYLLLSGPLLTVAAE